MRSAGELNCVGAVAAELLLDALRFALPARTTTPGLAGKVLERAVDTRRTPPPLTITAHAQLK